MSEKPFEDDSIKVLFYSILLISFPIKPGEKPPFLFGDKSMFYQSGPCFTNPVQSLFYHMPSWKNLFENQTVSVLQ